MPRSEPVAIRRRRRRSTGKPQSFCWNDNTRTTHEWQLPGDEDIDNITSRLSFDACEIEFEFLCHSEFPEVSFQYVFGSEEYAEYAKQNYGELVVDALPHSGICIVVLRSMLSRCATIKLFLT